MKHKFRSMGRVAIALVLAISLSLVMAAPAAAAVTGVTIEEPSAAVYVQPGGTFVVEYTVTTGAGGAGEVEFKLDGTIIQGPQAEQFPIAGANPLVTTVTVPSEQADAEYALTVTARQPAAGDPQTSAAAAGSVFVDGTDPIVPVNTLTSPNGGEGWLGGATQPITWNDGIITDDNLEANPITLYYSADGGTSWTLIEADLANTSPYSWNPVPSIASDTCRVKIVAVDKAGNTSNDTSDADFTIFAIDSTLPLVTLDTPATDGYVSGAEYAVKTKADTKDDQSGIASVKFEYSTDDGATWTEIATDTTGVGEVYEVAWDTTGIDDGTVLQVRATATNGVGAPNTDTETNITVDNAVPSVELTDPLGSAFIAATYAVKATATDAHSGVASVLFEYSIDGGTTWPDIGTDSDTTDDFYEVSWDTTGVGGGDVADVQVRATATDEVGKTATDANTAITIDNTDPAITGTTLTSPNGGEGWKVGTTQYITWTTADITDANLEGNPISLYYETEGTDVLIASGEANDGSYTWTVPGPPAAATCSVKIEAVDKAGNTSSDTSDADFTMYASDSTEPTVTVTAPATDGLVTGTYVLKATASDPDSGIAQVLFEYSIDGGTTWPDIGTDVFPPDGADSSYTFDWDTTAINEVDVQVRATATNGIGVTTVSVVNTGIIVDNTVPVIDAFVDPDVGDFIAGSAYAVKATVTDAHSGVASVLFEYSIDGGNTWPDIGTATTAVGDVYEVDWDTTAIVEDLEAVQVKATATDKVEKTATDTNATITIDNTDPAITGTTLTSPNGGEKWQGASTHEITWNDGIITDDNLEANPITLYYSADGGTSWTLIEADLANTSPYSWNPVPDIASTLCQVKIEAVDKAGNKVEDVSDANFTIDNTNPTLVLTAPATDGYAGGSTYAVKATANDGESGITSVLFEYSTDDGVTWTEIGSDTSSPYEVSWDASAMADGAIVQVRATATNGVALTTTVINTNITVDNSAPSVSLTVPAADATISGTVSVTATASDAGSEIASVKFEYSTDGGGSWSEIGNDTSSPYQVSWDTVGINYEVNVLVRAVATNGSSLTAESVNSGITVDNVAPGEVTSIDLVEGWNLISLMLIPEDETIEVVLADLIADVTVDQVRTYQAGVWSGWGAPFDVPLAYMEDGVGFWVNMHSADTLVVTGYELCEPAPAVPPEYSVVVGWNLIGFKFTTPGTIDGYLGDVNTNLDAIYGYVDGAYFIPTTLEPGLGYWIAVTLPGTIYPNLVSP